MASLVTYTGFVFLTANSIVAIHRSHGDLAAISFVVASYLALVLLFLCLRRLETAPADSVTRNRVKVVVWLLTTLLTTMFSWRVSELLPWPVAIVVWLMAASTVLGGFYAFFLLPRGGD